MQHQGYIEILPGIWYQEATGLPWSTKYLKHHATGHGTYCCYDGKLKMLKNKSKGYINIFIDGKCNKWHRLVYEYFKGNIPNNMEVDHYDNNRFNNKISNLLLLTHIKNTQKRLKPITNTSGYMGVSWNKSVNKYIAFITYNKKRIHLGCFNDAKEAYKVYLQSKIKYHGAESIDPLSK